MPLPSLDDFAELIEKNILRVVLIGGAIAFVGVFVYAVHMESYNVPPPDMKTPFADTAGRPMIGGKKAQDQLRGNLSIQNMSAHEIAQKFSDIVADSLSFTKSNYAYNSSDMQKYFTPEGYKQYAQFLQSSGLQQNVEGQGLRSGAYVELSPLQLNEGVYGGAYKWLFEVPVTISFIGQEASTYRDQAEPPQNRRFLLRAQFARVPDATDPDAIKIEIWQALPPRKTQ